MAKAVNETTTWILLRDARAFLTETYQAPALAERSLIRWLEAGRVRWRCLGMEGRTQSSDPGQGAPEFWQAELVGPRNAGGSRQVIKLLHVNWAESSAYRKISPMHGYTAFRIELAREDILKFFPPAAKAPAQTAAVRWILANSSANEDHRRDHYHHHPKRDCATAPPEDEGGGTVRRTRSGGVGEFIFATRCGP